jgi:hypothetical protein
MSDARNSNPSLAPSKHTNGPTSVAFGAASWTVDSVAIPDWVYRRFGPPDHESDGELRQRIVSELQRRLGSQVRHFQVLAHSDGLILRGEVRSYYGKQLAQEVVMQIAGLSILANDIDVRCVDFDDGN